MLGLYVPGSQERQHTQKVKVGTGVLCTCGNHFRRLTACEPKEAGTALVLGTTEATAASQPAHGGSPRHLFVE
jgi:hypothetical protein